MIHNTNHKNGDKLNASEWNSLAQDVNELSNWKVEKDPINVYFTKNILENGSIVDYDGSYYVTDQTVRTKRYYSLEGLDRITFNNYSEDSTVVLPYNIFYYDRFYLSFR